MAGLICTSRLRALPTDEAFGRVELFLFLIFDAALEGPLFHGGVGGPIDSKATVGARAQPSRIPPVRHSLRVSKSRAGNMYIVAGWGMIGKKRRQLGLA
jgi:hypothetical protein